MSATGGKAPDFSLSVKIGDVRFDLRRAQALVDLLDEVNDDAGTSVEAYLYDRADALIHSIKLLLSSAIADVDALEFPVRDLEGASSDRGPQ